MKPAFRHDDSLDSTGSGGSAGQPQSTNPSCPVIAGLELPTNQSRMDMQHNSGGVSFPEGSWTSLTDARGGDTRLMSQEGVFQLTKDLRTFSEALTALKTVFLDERNVFEKSQRVLAHERLSELLQVLKMVVDKYVELNSSEILGMAGILIQHIKEYNYEDERLNASPDIFRAINNLAMAFSNSVSECLMGEHISPRLSMTSSASFDNYETNQRTSESMENPQDLTNADVAQPEPTTPENVDELLQRMDAGLDMAFERAKVLSKYLSDLMSFVKKKAQLETEYSKNLQKLAQTTKPILSEQSFLPFQSLYCTALDHDREFGSNCQAMYQLQILQQKFLEPLQAKKMLHDKRRKFIRDSWVKEKRRSEEAILNMKKAKQTYQVKVQEYHKAKEAAIKAESDQSQQSHPTHQRTGGSTSQSSSLSSVLYSAAASGKMEKKKRQEEDSNLKATQAEHNYKAFVMEANKRLRDLERNKVTYLQQLRDLMTQSDQTAQTVTIAYFQLHQQLFSPLPVQYQAMCEDAKRYEPGFQYAEYVRNLPNQPYHSRPDFQFEKVSVDGTPYLVSGRSMDIEDYHGKHTSHTHKSSKGLSDTESSSSRSLDDISPSASPGDLTRAPRRLSNAGSLSSEENLADKDVPGSNLALPSEQGVGVTPESSPVPHRHQTTKPASKIATMAANVQRAFKSKKATKSSLFGVEFAVAAQDSSDGIPYLVKRCIAEIDNRALNSKGIYRVNGVKNRVEKLCTQFDLAPERLDLSQQSPHDVSGVLKYFLRQLPEPLTQFHKYGVFLDIAKDYQQVITSTNEAINHAKEAGLPMPPPPGRDVLDSFVHRLKDTIESLPLANRNTLQYIISHLTRIASQSHDNKMTANNLAIVFGPTLLRPQLTDGNESLKTLIDMPYQSRIVELLLIHKDAIFGMHTHSAGNIFPYADSGADIRDSAGLMGDSSLLDLAVSDNQAGGTSVPDGIRNNLYSRPNVLDLAASSTGSRQNFIDFSPKTGVAPRLAPDSPTPSVPLRNRSRKTSANRTEKLKYDEALSEPATPVGDPGENPSHTDPLKSMYRRMSSVSKLTKGLARRPTLQKSGSLDNVTDPTTPETKPIEKETQKSRKLPTLPSHMSNSGHSMAGRTPPQPSLPTKSNFSLPNNDPPTAKRSILLDDFETSEEKEASFC